MVPQGGGTSLMWPALSPQGAYQLQIISSCSCTRIISVVAKWSTIKQISSDKTHNRTINVMILTAVVAMRTRSIDMPP